MCVKSLRLSNMGKYALQGKRGGQMRTKTRRCATWEGGIERAPSVPPTSTSLPDLTSTADTCARGERVCEKHTGLPRVQGYLAQYGGIERGPSVPQTTSLPDLTSAADTCARGERDWKFVAKQSVSGLHILRIVPHTVPRRPLIRAFSGWIRTPPPTARGDWVCVCEKVW